MSESPVKGGFIRIPVVRACRRGCTREVGMESGTAHDDQHNALLNFI
jgi:hypothetical protein